MPDQSPEPPTKQIDARSLRAVAHPLRIRILQHLWTDGPATATTLAKLLDESTGTLSWHLRLLAAHGFIEEDPGRGTRRERWWRSPEGTISAEARTFHDHPELWDQLAAYAWANLEWHLRLVAEFQAAARARRVDPDWYDGVAFTSWTGERTRMSPRQLAVLRDEAHAVITRHEEAARAAPEPDAEQVVVLCYTFPYRPVTDR